MEENILMNSNPENKAEDEIVINEVKSRSDIETTIDKTETQIDADSATDKTEAQTDTESVTDETETSAYTNRTDESEDPTEVEKKAHEIVEQLKELVKKGNVNRIRVRKDDTIILNLPMTVGVLGTVLGLAAAPWAVIIGAISTVGLSCTVEVEKKDGSRMVIYGKEV